MADLAYINGDIAVSKYGDLALCSGDYEDEDIIQTANNNIILRYGGNKFHGSLGNSIYVRRVKANDNGLKMVEEECAIAIRTGDTRIKEVVNVSASIGENGNCLVSYSVKYLPSYIIVGRNNNIEDYLREVHSVVYVNAFNSGGTNNG